MILLRIWFDTKDKDAHKTMMHGIKTRVEYLLKDSSGIVGDSIINHYVAGRLNEVQEIEIVDAEIDDENCYGAGYIAVYLINVLRNHPHVTQVLIYDDGTDNTSMFIDENSATNIDGFKEIINPLN